eukprot:gene34102-44060_t
MMIAPQMMSGSWVEVGEVMGSSDGGRVFPESSSRRTSAKAPAAPSWQFSFKATAYLLFDDFPSKDKLLAKVVEL